MQYNLFIEHHAQSQPQTIDADIKKGGIGTGWEDLFTNMLSFYFRCDSRGLEAFCRLILNRDFEKPVAIETQKKYKQGIPDIIITLQSGVLLIIECKVDASLQPNQLQRYLKIKSPSGQNSFVVLVSKHSIEVPKAVLENPRYKYPQNRPHFFWTDLFKALPIPKSGNSGSEVFRSLFSDYMELIGFAPSSLDKPWPKLYEDRTIEDNQRVQKEFARKLSTVRSWLKTQDFKVTSVAHKGIQAIPKSGPLAKSPICFLKIAPEKVRRDHILRGYASKLDSEVLRIALVYDSPELSDHAWRIYNAFPKPLKDSNGFYWWPTEPYKFSKDRLRLEFVSNLNRFLEKDSEIEKRIKIGCVTIIKKISKIIQNINHNTHRCRREWNESEFFNEVKSKLEKDEFRAMQRVYKFCKSHMLDINWGIGNTRGSLNAYFNNPSRVKIFSVETTGRLYMSFRSLSGDSFMDSFRAYLKSEVINKLGLKPASDFKKDKVRIDHWVPKVKKLISILEDLHSKYSQRPK